jgi:TRAP-type transport system periplasmic protein
LALWFGADRRKTGEEIMIRICRTTVAAAALAALPLAAGAVEPITLKYGSPVPAKSWPNTRAVFPWTKSVEKESGGLLKFTVYVGGSVVNQRNVYDRTLAGVVDCMYGAIGHLQGTFKKALVPELPFEVNSALDASLAAWRLYKNGLTADEFANVHVLALYVYNPSGLHTNRPIHTAEDLQGIKLGTLSRGSAEELKLLGGTPVTMVPGSFYESINRGLISGVVMGWTGTQTFRTYELTKYDLDVPFGNNPGGMLMNKASYARLPAKAKAAIDKHSGETYSRLMGTLSDTVEDESRAHVKKLPGHHVSTLDAKEAERWKKILAPISEEWVKRTPDGAKVLAAYRAELAKLRTTH